MSITNPLPRFTVKVTGESGQGINSVGEVLAKSLKSSGYFTFGYREYPSLIKGGHGSHQIDFSDRPLTAPSEKCNIIIALSRVAVHHYLDSIADGGTMLHTLPKIQFSEAEQQLITDRNLNILEVPALKIAYEAGGKSVMINVVVLGMVWQMLQLAIAPLEEVIREAFAKKPDVIDTNLACLQAGYKQSELELPKLTIPFATHPERANDAIISGNHAIALGSITAGVKVYYAYPMTPSSSILSYLASVYHDTGMVVKQVEDEISVAQMAIGSMFMGTRALVGTSGGGFDLMTESVSLSGMTETPFVCVLAQRPGPATGLPTWSSATDLNVAVFAAHGEYTRLVISCSDIESCYTTIQHAFNLAEEFQIPVVLLTEKQIAESLFQLDSLPDAVPIERHLVAEEAVADMEPHDRFRITPSGVSPRWLPGQSKATYNGNSDEHLEDGTLTEDAQPAKAMYDKRLRKAETLKNKLPEPELIGPESAHCVFVGWGSVKNTMVDVIDVWNEKNPDKPIAYFHYEYLWPLRTAKLQHMIDQNKKLILMEQNAFGQLGAIITQKTGYIFEEQYLKYDGRPFFVEEVWEYVTKLAENC